MFNMIMGLYIKIDIQILLRLTPLYGIVILFVSTLLVHMGSGPFWMYMHEESAKCAQNWWTNILYINNFVAQDK